MPETTYSTPLGRGWNQLLLEVPGLLEALGDHPDLGPPIYQLVAPPGTGFPYVVWQVVSDVGVQHLEGRSALSRARVQTKCYALVPEQAEALAELLRLALDGRLHGVSAGGLNIRRLVCVDRGDDYEPPGDGTEAGAFSVRRDWELWYGLP